MEYYKTMQGHISSAMSGKIPFENIAEISSNMQVAREDSPKQSVDAMTPWSVLMRLAEERDNPPSVPNVSYQHFAPFNDPLLDTALNKSAKILSGSTGYDVPTIKRVIVGDWKQNINARKTVFSTLRFFRDFDESVFTECSECGSEIDVQTERCSNKLCGMPKEL